MSSRSPAYTARVMVVRLVAATFCLLGLGLHIWLLSRLWRWARLPLRYTDPLVRVGPAPHWIPAALWSIGGLLLAGYGVTATVLPLPAFTAQPWQYLPYITLGPVLFAWLLRNAVMGELLHLRAYQATRGLLAAVERLAARHGGDVGYVRRSAESILSTPTPRPEEAARPWHDTASLTALLENVPRGPLTKTEKARLDRALSRYRKAVARFDGYRR
jgi:hypothetical protein